MLCIPRESGGGEAARADGGLEKTFVFRKNAGTHHGARRLGKLSSIEPAAAAAGHTQPD
jgi:hypothetical protein